MPETTEPTLHDRFTTLREALQSRIMGQAALVDRLLIALLADGHLLVEGAPGLAKTTAIKTLSQWVESTFQRIQFTPDLLPADLTGTDIYRPQTGTFEFQPGPLFHSLVLADEVNRAPAKVQSALLEAMGERQITVGRTTYPLPPLFLVMATQNPIEQEGTYPLPEAQLDRFLMYVRVDYPDVESERAILQLARHQARLALNEPLPVTPLLNQTQIFQARAAILDIHFAPVLEEYIVQFVIATRKPALYGAELAHWVSFGASPRGTLALDRCARAHAWLQERDYVMPDDIHAIIHDSLRHRINLSFEAQAEGVTTDRFIDELLKRVPVP